MIFKQRWIALKRDQRGGHRKYREKGFTPMKIAVWHNLPSGGGKRALYYHVRGLVERGHEITCWSLDTADHSYLPLSEFASEHVVACRLRNGSRKRIAGDSAAYYRVINEMRAFDE